MTTPSTWDSWPPGKFSIKQREKFTTEIRYANLFLEIWVSLHHHVVVQGRLIPIQELSDKSSKNNLSIRGFIIDFLTRVFHDSLTIQPQNIQDHEIYVQIQIKPLPFKHRFWWWVLKILSWCFIFEYLTHP